MGSEQLSVRRHHILDYLIRIIDERGYPPSMREIAAAVGLKSASTVLFHLRALEKAGYIQRTPHRNRAITPLTSGSQPEHKPRYVPLIGQVAAGEPIFAVENITDTLPLPAALFSGERLFMLEVIGNSMIDDGIHDGDLVVVNHQPTADPGDIIVALLEDEATVKRFYPRADTIELRPANPEMDSVIVDDVQIIGRVVGVVRLLQ